MKQLKALTLNFNIETPSFINISAQKEKLGKYYIEKPVPISNKVIRPELFGLFPHLQTDGLKSILETEKLNIQEDKVNIEFLLGISGSGKTFKLFAKSIHQDFYLLYIICTPPNLTRSIGNGFDFSNCLDFTEVTDPSYQLLLKRLLNYSFVSRHVYVDSEVQLFLMSRLLYLFCVINKTKDLTPQLFLQYQVNGYLKHIETVYSNLLSIFEPSKLSAQFLLEINSKILKLISKKTGRNVGFGIDEMNSTDVDVLNLTLLSKTSDKLVGFTNYFLSNIISLGKKKNNIVNSSFYLGVSGTNFDMASCQSYISGLFKDNSLNIYFGKVDSINCKQDIISFFSKFINVKHQDFINAINDDECCKILLGRKRPLARLISNIRSRSFKDSAMTVYTGIRNSLLSEMEIKLKTVTALFWEGICKLFHIVCLSRTVGKIIGDPNSEPNLLYLSNNLSWIPTGLCNIEVNNKTGEENIYKISLSTEAFVMDTLIEFIKKHRITFLEQFTNHLSQTPEIVSPQAFGSIFEILIITHIISKQNFKVMDFTQESYIIPSKHNFLPNDSFQFTHFGFAESFGFVDFLDFMQEGVLLAQKLQEKVDENLDESTGLLISKVCGKLVKPPDIAHQDLVSFQYCDRLNRISLVEMSLKYSDSSVTDSELLKSIFQLRTDMMFGDKYCSTNGFTPNSEHKELIKKLQTIPSFKIHIAYPVYTYGDSITTNSSAKRLSQEVRELILNKKSCSVSGLLTSHSISWIDRRLSTPSLTDNLKEEESDNNAHLQFANDVIVVNQTLNTPTKESKLNIRSKENSLKSNCSSQVFKRKKKEYFN